jgi:hypothetical protein
MGLPAPCLLQLYVYSSPTPTLGHPLRPHQQINNPHIDCAGCSRCCQQPAYAAAPEYPSIGSITHRYGPWHNLRWSSCHAVAPLEGFVALGRMSIDWNLSVHVSDRPPSCCRRSCRVTKGFQRARVTSGSAGHRCHCLSGDDNDCGLGQFQIVKVVGRVTLLPLR